MILTGNELNDPEHKVLNEIFWKIEKSDTHNNLIILQTKLTRNWLHCWLGHIM